MCNQKSGGGGGGFWYQSKILIQANLYQLRRANIMIQSQCKTAIKALNSQGFNQRLLCNLSNSDFHEIS